LSIIYFPTREEREIDAYALFYICQIRVRGRKQVTEKKKKERKKELSSSGHRCLRKEEPALILPTLRKKPVYVEKNPHLPRREERKEAYLLFSTLCAEEDRRGQPHGGRGEGRASIEIPSALPIHAKKTQNRKTTDSFPYLSLVRLSSRRKSQLG